MFFIRIACVVRYWWLWDCYAPAHREGGNQHWFCPSVSLSVCPFVRFKRIIREPKGLACPNLEGSFATFDATCVPVSRSKGQRSGLSRPLMLMYIVRHIFQMARPTNFKLDTQMEDDNPHQPQAPWPPRSKFKVARSRDQSEPSWPNAVAVSLDAGGGIPCRPNPVATLLVSHILAVTVQKSIVYEQGAYRSWKVMESHGI